MHRATILGVAAVTLLVGCHGAAEPTESPGERAADLAEQSRRAPNDADLLMKAARAHVAVAGEWRAAGSDPQPPLLDAREAYRRVVEVAPGNADAWLEAAAVEQELGDDAAARRLFLQHLKLGCAAAGSEARSSAEVEAQRSELFAALGAPAAAVRAAGRALAIDPENVALHQRRTDLCFQAGEVERLLADCEELHARFPESATATWYAGYASLLAGDAARRERRFDAARRDYEAARRDLAAAAAQQSDYAEMSRRIDHLAALGLAWTALESGDLNDAEARLLERLAQARDLALEADGFRRTLIDALARLGADDEHAGDFAAGARVMQALTEVEPERAYWWNNLGYFLREQASLVADGRVAGDGDAKQAAEAIFRRSWAAYLKAVELAPDDARIVNDAALIQVYHLRDELDRAEAMLRDAIRIGEAELAAMGEKPPESERYPVAQAVGDAWQNLAYLYYHVRPDFPKVKECVENSIATRTDAREGLRVYVDAVEGRHAPIPERPVAAAVLAPRREDPPKGQIAWQRSFADACALAATERQPVFVFCRGDGLGVGAPYLDQVVARKPFADAAAGAACVVADRARHTAVDRDATGRRIVCPRHGVVTCGEHQRAYDEVVAAWPTLKLTDEGDVPTEGLLLFAWTGPRVATRAGVGAAEWFAQAALPPGGMSPLVFDLPTLLSDLLWNEGPAQPAAAAELLATPGAAARDAVEAILKLAPSDALPIGGGGGIVGHELVIPTSAVAAMVAALAARDDATARELLDACVGPHTDPDACALALADWPAGADLERVKRVLQWSDSARARKAAAEALRRLDPSEETEALLELDEASPR